MAARPPDGLQRVGWWRLAGPPVAGLAAGFQRQGRPRDMHCLLKSRYFIPLV